MHGCEQHLVEGFQARNEELHRMALQSFEQALKHEPEDDAIRLEVARSQFDVGMVAEARATLDSVSCPDSDDGEFLLDIGRVWMTAGEADRALACFSMIKPEHAEFEDAILEGVMLLERSHERNGIGKWLAGLGGSSRSLPHAQLARAIGASVVGDHETALAEYERLWKTDKTSVLGLEAGYRLARLHARNDRVGRGLEILGICKSAEARQMPGMRIQQAIQQRRSFDRELLSCISENWFEEREKIIDPENLMILGHPRSGTSLIAKRLAKASGACWVDESRVFETMGQRWVEGKQEAASPRGMCKLLQELTQGETEEFSTQYRRQLNAFRDGRDFPIRTIDKNPGVTASLVTLHKLLPKVAWLMVLRDPRDIAMSCYFQRFGPTQLGWACQTAEGALAAVTHVLAIWTEVCKQLPPASFVSLKYEDFVADEKTGVGALMEALGWENTPENAAKDSVGPRINMTPSYSDIHQPTYQFACHRWKTAESLFAIDGGEGRRLLDQLGYELQ